MSSASITFDLPNLSSPSGNDTGSTRKGGMEIPRLPAKEAGVVAPKAEGQAPVASFRRAIAHAAKVKDFSAEGHPASPAREALAPAGSASQVAETAKNPKKSGSKKTPPVPAAVAFPATGNVWAGFVLPLGPSAPHPRTDTASAILENQTASTHTAKTPQAGAVENSTGQASLLLPVIPLKSHGVENSTGPSAEFSAPPSGASILPQTKALFAGNQDPLKNAETFSPPAPTNRVTETMVGASSVPAHPPVHGQKGKAPPGTAGTGKASRDSVFPELSTANQRESGTGALPAATESRLTDKAGKVNLGDGSGSDAISVQPPLSTALPSTNSFVLVPALSTAMSGGAAVATPPAPILPIGAFGWQAVLASRAASLQPGQSLLVRTDPAALGPIQVEATLRTGQGNGLHIQLTVKHSGTAQMLQQGAPVIAQMITTASAGVPVSVGVTLAHPEPAPFPSFSFSQGNPGQGNSGRGARATAPARPVSSIPAVEQERAEASPASRTKGFESWV